MIKFAGKKDSCSQPQSFGKKLNKQCIFEPDKGIHRKIHAEDDFMVGMAHPIGKH
jgi:hypothetical protein